MNCWGKTDIGLVRKQNEDSFYMSADKETALCCVCDGMGGANAGDIASKLAVEAFVDQMEGSAASGKPLVERMQQAVACVNTIIFEKSQEDMRLAGMGTTLVGACVQDDQAFVINVGDSRAYLISPKSGIRCITRDHSVVADMIEQGDLTWEEAKHHPSKNLITRAIGTERTVQCDIYRETILKGEYLLLCSDGLSNIVTDQEMLFEVVHGKHPEDCCDRLIQIALEKGAPDNVTAVLIRR